MREIEFALTKADYRELYFFQTWRRIWKFGLFLGILLSAWFGMTDYCRCGRLDSTDAFRATFTGLGIALIACAMILALNTWSGTRVFDYLKRLNLTSHLNWDDEYVHIRSQYATASYPWSLPCEWTETRSLLVIYLAVILPLVIPKRALEHSEIEAIKQYLEAAKVKKLPRL